MSSGWSFFTQWSVILLRFAGKYSTAKKSYKYIIGGLPIMWIVDCRLLVIQHFDISVHFHVSSIDLKVERNVEACYTQLFIRNYNGREWIKSIVPEKMFINWLLKNVTKSPKGGCACIRRFLQPKNENWIFLITLFF